MATGNDGRHAASRAPPPRRIVGGVCFKLGPPQLVGAELEWLTTSTTATVRSGPPRSQPHVRICRSSPRPSGRTHPPPSSPILARASAPVRQSGHRRAGRSDRTLQRSLLPRRRTLRRLARRRTVPARTCSRPTPSPSRRRRRTTAHRPARRLLQLPRYCAMEDRFDRIGPFGKLMMCNTAATQVSVDAGADRRRGRRPLAALNAIGPALLAAFACSPRLHGIPRGSLGLAADADLARTWTRRGPRRRRRGSTRSRGYARWALDAPLLCVRRATGASTTGRAPLGRDVRGLDGRRTGRGGRPTPGPAPTSTTT